MKLLPTSRRQFILQGALVTLAFAGLRNFYQGGLFGAALEANLKPDPDKILDLPPGFSYHAISKAGDEMSDGLLVPGCHDGMGTFVGAGGRTVLVRNHEVDPGWVANGPFGMKRERLAKVDTAKLYDAGSGKRPGLGGTTTLV